MALLALVVVATVWLAWHMTQSRSSSVDARQELDLRDGRGEIGAQDHDDRVERIGQPWPRR